MSSSIYLRQMSCACKTFPPVTGRVRTLLIHASASYHVRSSSGYNAPQNLQNYAAYLDSRIRAYRDLKHDAVRVQAESNRDMRMSMVIPDDVVTSKKGSGSGSAGVTRSLTVAGRKLKMMTVEKGLLRETKAVLRTIDALVTCRVRFDMGSRDVTLTFNPVLPRRPGR